MNTYNELLEVPEFQKQFDQKIIAFINNEYLRLGSTPPLPKFRDNRLIYDDPRICKLVERLRSGGKILATLMDQNEEKALKAKEKAST